MIIVNKYDVDKYTISRDKFVEFSRFLEGFFGRSHEGLISPKGFGPDLNCDDMDRVLVVCECNSPADKALQNGLASIGINKYEEGEDGDSYLKYVMVEHEDKDYLNSEWFYLFFRPYLIGLDENEFKREGLADVLVDIRSKRDGVVFIISKEAVASFPKKLEEFFDFLPLTNHNQCVAYAVFPKKHGPPLRFYFNDPMRYRDAKCFLQEDIATVNEETLWQSKDYWPDPGRDSVWFLVMNKEAMNELDEFFKQHSVGVIWRPVLIEERVDTIPHLINNKYD